MDSKEDLNTIDLSRITFDDDLIITSPSLSTGATGGTFVFASPSGLPTYTISSSGTSAINLTNDVLSSDWLTANSGKMILHGENADIDINGVSLMKTLQGIQDRLNMLRPNTELESEWDELRELGERYRELEQKIQDKMKTWDAISRRR